MTNPQQPEIRRSSRDLARCDRVVLEDIEGLAQRSVGGITFAKHDPRTHQLCPAVDISRRSIEPARKPIDHRSDRRVMLARRHRLGLGLLVDGSSVAALAGGPRLQRRDCL